jgi:hypothetical protein
MLSIIKTLLHEFKDRAEDEESKKWNEFSLTEHVFDDGHSVENIILLVNFFMYLEYSRVNEKEYIEKCHSLKDFKKNFYNLNEDKDILVDKLYVLATQHLKTENLKKNQLKFIYTLMHDEKSIRSFMLKVLFPYLNHYYSDYIKHGYNVTHWMYGRLFKIDLVACYFKRFGSVFYNEDKINMKKSFFKTKKNLEHINKKYHYGWIKFVKYAEILLFKSRYVKYFAYAVVVILLMVISLLVKDAMIMSADFVKGLL